MNQEIKVSVVIPIYNAERHLAQCLESVLKQSLQEIEVICVDDGSTDRSPEILRQYAQKDNRVRILSQKNQHAGVARNNGMKAARGRYLAFLDADDYYIDGALEQLLQVAEQNHLDFVKGSFFRLDVSSNLRYTTYYSTNSCISHSQRKRVLSFRKLPARLLNAADVPWNGLYRRTFLEKSNIHFNSLRCMNDHSFYIHCLLKAKRIMITNCNVTCYRTGQADSLIGRKAMNYSCQLESYAIVRQLCQSTEQPLARRVLQQELNGVFDWYQKLRPAAADPEALDLQLREFLQRYDEEDVGADFLREFSFLDLYYKLRYGIPAPGRRPIIPVRLFHCLQEHGWYYTFCLVCNKKMGGKPCG